jgi:large subunit ribosomal protein L25
MAHQTPTLAGELRQQTGTRYAARLRRAGKLPAVIYGHGKDPEHIALDGEGLTQHLQHGAHLLEVKLGSGRSETVLIRDVQYDYLGDYVIHVDLARVDLSEEVEVTVPLTTKGEERAPGLKHAGAFLEHPLTELEVRCRADAIPDQVAADIGELEINDTMQVSDLVLPPGVTAVTPPETVVAAIHVSKVTEEDLEETPAEAAEGAEPEVLTERKEEEGGAAEEAGD